MRSFVACVALTGAIIRGLADSPRQTAEDPEIRAAVERFFAVQEAEDVEAYIALWSRSAPRLLNVAQLRMQLKFVFDSGDDKFSNVTIVRVLSSGDRLRVRVSAMRARTSVRPNGTTSTIDVTLLTGLTFVREGGTLKLVSEGSPSDELADSLLAAPTPEAREALLGAEPELVTNQLVQSLSRRGDAAAQTQQYALAEAIYQRVLDLARRIGGHEAEGQALQNIGNSKYFRRDFVGALDAYEQRLVVEREAASDEGIAAALLGIATIKYSTYEYTAALASYEEALGLQEKLQDGGGVGTTLLSTGNVRYLQGNLEGAIADYGRSRDAQRKVGNTEGEAKALEGLGRAFAAQGNLGEALDAYAGVLEEGRARADRAAQGNAVRSIGELQLRLGNLDVARKLFDESRAHFEALNDQANVGRIWGAAALTDLIATRYGAAEQGYAKSSAVCQAVSEPDCVARALVGRAYAQASQSHYEEAIVTYGKAIAAFTALKKLEDAARAELGLSEAFLGKKEYMAALVSAGRARLQAVAINEDDVLWRAATAEARAARRLKTPDRAMTAAKDAVAAVVRLGQAALERPGERVPGDVLEAYAFLALLQAEAGDPAAAFDTSQQRRAVAMRVALATNERTISKGMTAEERERERAASATLATLYLQLDHERSLPKPDAARLTRFTSAIVEASRIRDDERQQLFDRLPALKVWRGLAPAPAVADVAAWLTDPDTLLVEFLIDDDDLLVLTAAAREGKLEVHAYSQALTRQGLGDKVARLADIAVLRSVDDWQKASADFVAALPAEAVAALSAAKRAILVPESVLWRVPFEALPVKDGTLGDRTPLSYAGSVASLMNAPGRSDRAAGVPLLAVAAPELSPALADRISVTAPGWVIRASDGADLEAKRAAAPFSEPAAAVMTGATATEAAVRAAASDAAVLHIAAPFRMNSASPLFSQVLLGGDLRTTADADPAADGLFEAREIMNLTLAATIGVISDGSSASMRDAAGVTPVIQWAWRVAGVPTLVLRRWTADPEASTELIAAFHQGVKAGKVPEIALREAQAALRAREGMAAPYFWADWMVVGR